MPPLDKKISELDATLSLLLGSDNLAVVNDGITKKITVDRLKKSLQALGVGGVIQLPAGAGLTSASAGLLIQNKNGEAFVAARDTPEAGEAGQWKFTFTDPFPATIPSEVMIELTSVPKEGEKIYIGTKQLTWSNTGGGKNIITIGATVADCVLNLDNALTFSQYQNRNFSNTADFPNNRVFIKFDGSFNDAMGRPSGLDRGTFIPPFGNMSFEVSTNSANWSYSTPGQDFIIGRCEEEFCSGALSLKIRDLMQQSFPIAGTNMLGVKFVADKFLQAETLELAIAAVYPGDFSVSRVGAEVTVTALNAPKNQGESDINMGNDLVLNYVSLETKAYNRAPFPDYLSCPVVGKLLFVEGGVAYIDTSSTFEIELEGTEPCAYKTNPVTGGFDTFLVPSAGGKLETLTSYAAAIGGNPAPDIFKVIDLYQNLYSAKSSGAPGDKIVASKLEIDIRFILNGA